MNRNLLLSRMLRGALAAGALAAAPAGVALADDNRGGRGRDKDKDKDKDKDDRRGAASLAQRRAAMGTIKSIDNGAKSLVVTTKHGDLTITTNADTTFHGPREATATFASLVANQRVLVTGDRPNATTLLAKRIMLLPAQDDRAGRKGANQTVTVGVVSDLAGDRSSLKITPTGGSALTVKITADTSTLLKGTAQLANGVTARVISVKDASGAEVARRIQVPATA